MKNIIAAILFTIVTLSIAAAGYGQYTSESESFKKFQLIPVDASSDDKVFQSFIKDFRRAVARKDMEYIKKHVSSQIVHSFDENGAGDTGFYALWKLDSNYKTSAFWDEMERVLATVPASSEEEGCRIYVFPYVFDKFPGDEYDSYSYAAVTAKKVNVRETASQKGKVIAVLDYEVVKIIEVTPEKKKVKVGGKSGSWVKVETSSGKKGYIFDYYLHSPIGYRAIFKKYPDTWKLTHFISGD